MDKKPTFLCDVDGIGADFVKAAVLIMNRISGQAIELDHVTSWDVTQLLQEEQHKAEAKQAFLERGFCSSFEEYSGTTEAVARLNAISNFYFVTAPMFDNKSWMEERADWLMSRYGVRGNQVNFITDKFLTRGDFLLDDSNKNCELWAKSNPFGRALLWDRPHNRHEDHPSVLRVHTWDEVIRIVEASLVVFNDPY